MHGDSTVCASIDLREHPAVRRLTLDHLNEAILQQQSANQQPSPPPPPSMPQQPPTQSKAQTPLTSPGAATSGPSSGGDSVPKARRVILAPFGISGTLTGQVYRVGSLDAATQKALDGWCAFYPLTVTPDSPDDLPIMVEVVTGGVKLRYPTKYVLVSDLDDFEAATEGAEEDATQLAGIKGAVPYRVAVDMAANSRVGGSSIKRNVDLKQETKRSGFTESLGNDLNHPLSTHFRPTVATVLPERVWQDCMVSSRLEEKDKASAATALPMLSPSQIKQEPGCESAATAGGGAVNSGLFKYNDPTQKAPCACVK